MNKSEELRGKLIYLNKHWHVSIAGIARESNIHLQHLNNFKLGKDRFGDIRLKRLEKVLNGKYKLLLKEYKS
ncbi:hypothetical protein ABQE01_05105 [Enterococcus thailandicus]|uniref:hypothetical protein n=1 Tax=Enterococcus TaxID=1350 RepID=UPI0022E2BB8A|nr:hypothetical protein [Enterococcus lactis]